MYDGWSYKMMDVYDELERVGEEAVIAACFPGMTEKNTEPYLPWQSGAS